MFTVRTCTLSYKNALLRSRITFPGTSYFGLLIIRYWLTSNKVRTGMKQNLEFIRKTVYTIEIHTNQQTHRFGVGRVYSSILKLCSP